MIERSCEVCHKELTRKQKKFCSFECRCKFQVGKPSKSGTTFKKGRKPSTRWYELQSQGKVGFKKGYIPHNKDLKGYTNSGSYKKGQEGLRGENSPNWKGDNVGYGALHRWVESHLGKPQFCEGCGTEEANRYYEWANISGEYKRDLKDWLRLCKICHNRFDNIHEKIWKTRHERMGIVL